MDTTTEVCHTTFNTPCVTFVHTYLHGAIAAAQCLVIGPVCGWICVWLCYHDNSKLPASILTKLGL